MTTQTRIARPIFIGLSTPYLTKDQASFVEKCPTDLEDQIKRCGWDPNNLSGVRVLDSGKYNVILVDPEYAKEIGKTSPKDVDLLVAGSTPNIEANTTSLMGSGLIVARYSCFYPGASKYTGCYPDTTGYSLDIPKKVEIVKSLLTNGGFLDSIIARDEMQIRKAVHELNRTLEEPVLVTRYLSEALKIPARNNNQLEDARIYGGLN